MTIDGNIKIFELSKALLKDGATSAASTGAASEDNIIDFSKITRWQSVGSDDTTEETVTIVFQESARLSRLLFLDFNFKSYTVTPSVVDEIVDGSGSAITDEGSVEITDNTTQVIQFSNVTSSTNSISATGIAETDFELESQYYEFNDLYCSGLVIKATKTQPSEGLGDQEKYCYRCIPTIEIDSNRGTFEQFPKLTNTTDFKSINSVNLAGKNKIQKLDSTFSATLSFPLATVQNDIRIMNFIRNTNTDFILFPCGGKFSEDYFRFEAAPYDFNVYQMQVNAAKMAEYINNITRNAAVISVSLAETI